MEMFQGSEFNPPPKKKKIQEHRIDFAFFFFRQLNDQFL